ncbi:pre-toxin TG domain-containing protein [Paenibacillus larvae]|uniref:pre-toxin TG domain-containing protein n=1 Tax=Paenibacillus larvae TaxID=1464 RepID=UPI0037C6ECEA
MSLGFDFDFSSYLTLENVSVAIDLIPIVGNIKAGGKVISGYDPITGVRLEDLTGAGYHWYYCGR